MPRLAHDEAPCTASAIESDDVPSPGARLEVGVTWRDFADGVRSAGRHWAAPMEVDYAVSGALAAETLAPYLTTVSNAEVYVSAETILGLEAAAATAGLKPVEGGRLVLHPFPTVSVNCLATEVPMAARVRRLAGRRRAWRGRRRAPQGGSP